MEKATEAGSRGDDPQLERPALWVQAAPAHVLAEGGQRQLLGDLRLADERPAPMASHEVALADEVVERRPQREPRDAEVGAESALGWDRFPHAEVADQLDDVLPDLLLLRHVRQWNHNSPLVVKTINRRDTRLFREISLLTRQVDYANLSPVAGGLNQLVPAPGRFASGRRRLREAR